MAAQRSIAVIALGHHSDDQAETVMLQLLRGSSDRGLSAMASWRAGEAGIIFWRPLLGVARASIAEYANAHRLRWIDDESNADNRHKRNFLRNRLFPILETGFSGYRTSLSRAAERAAESAKLTDELADIDYRNSASDDVLPLAYLRGLGTLRTRNLLRRMLSRRGLAVPDADRLSEFVRQALSAERDRNPLLEVDSVHVLHSGRKSMRILAHVRTPPFHLQWCRQPELLLPHGILRFGLSSGAGIDALTVRSRIGGERCRVAANRPTRTLKNVFQEAGIPEPLRDGWPLLVAAADAAEVVVAIPDVAVSVDWQCPPGAPGWTVKWDPK
jgi:tRNA(Ile)-lysidine synthase